MLLLCDCSAWRRELHHDVIAYGSFAHVRIYTPPGGVHRLALVLSGDGGWGAPVEGIASALAAQGSLVAGIDSREWLAALRVPGPACVSPGAELAQLSHYLAGRYPLPSRSPVLIGHSAGASLAFVAVAQSRPGEFAGALTLSFCDDLDLARPLCPAAAFHETARPGGVRLAPAAALPAPWIALHGLDDRECPASEGREFAHRVPGSRFVPLPGATHSYRDAGRWWEAFLSSYDTLATSP